MSLALRWGMWWRGRGIEIRLLGCRGSGGVGRMGILERERVLGDVEGRKDEVSVGVVPGREEVEAFWGLVGEARSVLDAAKERKDEVGEEMKELRDVVELRTWDIRALLAAIERLKERLGLGDFIGYESKVD